MKFSTALSIFSVIPQSVLKSRLVWRTDTVFIQMLVWTSTGLSVVLKFECPSLTLCRRNPKSHYMLWPNSTTFFVTRLCNGLKLWSSLSIAFITYRNNKVYQRCGKKLVHLHSEISKCRKAVKPSNQPITWSMVRSSSFSQELPPMLRIPKVHYRGHRYPTLVSILNQTNPTHPSVSYFFIIHFNVPLPSTSRSYKWYLSFRFPTKTPYAFLFYSNRFTCP
jgi:hypothetical protein